MPSQPSHKANKTAVAIAIITTVVAALPNLGNTMDKAPPDKDVPQKDASAPPSKSDSVATAMAKAQEATSSVREPSPSAPPESLYPVAELAALASEIREQERKNPSLPYLTYLERYPRSRSDLARDPPPPYPGLSQTPSTPQETAQPAQPLLLPAVPAATPVPPEKAAAPQMPQAAQAAKEVMRLLRKSSTNTVAEHLLIGGNSTIGVNTGDTACSHGFWLQGLYTKTQQAARNSTPSSTLSGFSATSQAITVGWDRPVTLATPGDDLVVGAAFTAGTTTTHSHGVQDTDSTKSYVFHTYGQWQHHQWLTDAILSLGINQHHDQRYGSGSAAPLTADYQSHYASVRLLAGYTVTRGAWSIKPLVGLDYTQVHTAAYQERDPANSGLATATAASREHTLEVGAGLAVQRTVTVAKGQLIPAAKVMAWYDVAGQPVKTSSRLLLGASTWTVTEAQPPRTAWEADLTVSYARNHSTLVAGYNRNQETGFHSNNYYLQFKYDF